MSSSLLPRAMPRSTLPSGSLSLKQFHAISRDGRAAKRYLDDPGANWATLGDNLSPLKKVGGEQNPADHLTKEKSLNDYKWLLEMVGGWVVTKSGK